MFIMGKTEELFKLKPQNLTLKTSKSSLENHQNIGRRTCKITSNKKKKKKENSNFLLMEIYSRKLLSSSYGDEIHKV